MCRLKFEAIIKPVTWVVWKVLGFDHRWQKYHPVFFLSCYICHKHLCETASHSIKRYVLYSCLKQECKTYINNPSNTLFFRDVFDISNPFMFFVLLYRMEDVINRLMNLYTFLVLHFYICKINLFLMNLKHCWW